MYLGSRGIPTEDPLLSTLVKQDGASTASASTTTLGEAFTPEALAATAGLTVDGNNGNSDEDKLDVDDQDWCTRPPQGADESENAFMVRTCPFCQQGRRKATQRRASSSSSLQGSSSSSDGGTAAAGVGEAAGAVDNDEAKVGFRDAESAAFGEETLHCAGIWLHALKYTRQDPVNPEKDWAFQTSMPAWAQEGFREAP